MKRVMARNTNKTVMVLLIYGVGTVPHRGTVHGLNKVEEKKAIGGLIDRSFSYLDIYRPTGRSQIIVFGQRKNTAAVMKSREIKNSANRRKL